MNMLREINQNMFTNGNKLLMSFGLLNSYMISFDLTEHQFPQV